jgi:hypothetical protein
MKRDFAESQLYNRCRRGIEEAARWHHDNLKQCIDGADKNLLAAG